MSNGFLSRKAIGLTCLIVICVLLVSYGLKGRLGAGKTSDTEFTVGFLAPLTGDLADYGKRGLNSINMAVEEVNAQGGVKGKKIKVIVEDNKGTPKDAVAAMQKLVNVDKVPVVIGGLLSGVGLAIAPIAEQSKAVLLAPGSSSPDFREAGDYCFRNWASDDFDGKVMAGYMYENRGIRSVAVLTMQNDYCLGLSNTFKENFAAKGGTVVFHDEFPAETTEFQSLLAKVKAANPEAVFLSAHPKETGFLLKQMAELKIEAKIGSNMNAESPDCLSIAGTAANGVFFTTPAFDPASTDPRLSQFVAKYNERYGSEPDAVAGHFYDALHILAAAAKNAKDLTPDSIRDALYAIKDFPGVTGTTTFDEKGDVTKPLMIKEIAGGEGKVLQLYGANS